MAKLSDIAKKANVSLTTVSRILNNDQGFIVSLETRSLVLEIAKDLNYKVPKTRQVKQKIKIALIHWYTRDEELLDNYYLKIRLGIEKKAHELGIELIKVFYDDLNQNLEKLNGAIAVGKFDEKEIEILKQTYKHLVFVDSSPDEELFDSVVIDFEKAYKESIEYLLNKNITDIGYIGGREYTHSLKKPIGERREIYFRSYFPNQTKIHVGEFSIESGYKLMKEAIESKKLAKAYLVASDAMAIGALRALYEANIMVPEDISIIGFNDIEQSAYTIPALTTIKVFKEHMGETAIKLILERLEGREVSQKVIIQTKLIIRKSVKED